MSVAEIDVPEVCQSVNLPPAREALSVAIETAARARDHLQELHGPLNRLDRVLIAAQSVEAAGLRNEIDRMLTASGTGRSGSVTGEPLAEEFLSPELIEADERLSKLAEGSAEAGYRLSAARERYLKAAELVRVSSINLEEALWPATVEAADRDLRDLEEAIRHVLFIEARLRSLILALRETGNRGAPGQAGAFSAAEKIETQVRDLRRKPMLRVDLEIGRSFIHRLRSDAGATL